MKTYLKTLWRTFKKHITRFLSIIFMVLVSVGFISGVGSASDKIKYSLADYYETANVSDFILKDSTGDGFDSEKIKKVGDVLNIPEENCFSGSSFDVNAGDEENPLYVRIYFLDFDDWAVNIPQLTSGEWPDGKHFALCERGDNKLKELSAGTKFNVDFKSLITLLNGDDPRMDMMDDAATSPEVEICGIVQSPLLFGLDGEPSYLTDPDTEIPDTTNGVNSLDTLLSYVIYLSSDIIPTYGESMPNISDMLWNMLGMDKNATLLPKNADLYVTLADRDLFGGMSEEYKSEISRMKADIEAEFGDDVGVITLNDNYSFRALSAYAYKVMLIGYVLMVAFLFVTALVVLSTMTRLLEEERGQIACLSTLGYSPAKIVFKYLVFAAIATGAGGVGAYFIGMGVSFLLYAVFGYSFAMPPMSPRIAVEFFLIIFAVIVAVTLFATFLAGNKLTSERCADLLRPKPPKAGKKTVLEKIPFIWNRLSFKYKSTVRNVLRYKNRFIMTVVAVAFSTALVLAGLALLDLCLFHGVNSPSVMAVAIVIVIFAGLLTAVVIYTLTNINVSERNRELATLMVLGYYDFEVSGYIYREIYIDAVIGIIFGFPLSLIIMFFLFDIMAVGTIATVSWFVWLAAPAVVILFTAAVTLILRNKIVKIDMNESLKAIE